MDTSTSIRIPFGYICFSALITLLCLPTSTSAGAIETDGSRDRCPDSAAAAEYRLAPCLKMGEKFLKRYIKRQGRSSYLMCDDNYDFQVCIADILDQCPHVAMYIPEHWMSTILLFDCACNKDDSDYEGCNESLACLADEIEGMYAKNCYDKFEFNVQQGTHDRCDFYPEYVHCKEKLISSRCGLRAGTLHYLVHLITAREECDIRRLDNNRGMKYSEDCPSNLPEQIESCAVSSLDSSSAVMSFMADNDLIADGNSHAARLACGSYRKYNTCLSEWRDRCPVGVDIALQQNDDLRKYLLKMDYICHHQDYIDNIHCYQDVLEENMLSQCNDIWGRIEPLLSITAYQYYCREDAEAINLQNELDELTACYISIFNGTCGASASEAMGGLITKAFHDPFYLRFAFIPDCQLHEKLYHKKQQQKRKQAEKQKHHIRHHSGEEEQSHNNNNGGDNNRNPQNTGSPNSQQNPGPQSRIPKQRTQIKTQTAAHGSASSDHSRLGIYVTALISLVFTNL